MKNKNQSLMFLSLFILFLYLSLNQAYLNIYGNTNNCIMSCVSSSSIKSTTKAHTHNKTNSNSRNKFSTVSRLGIGFTMKSQNKNNNKFKFQNQNTIGYSLRLKNNSKIKNKSSLKNSLFKSNIKNLVNKSNLNSKENVNSKNHNLNSNNHDGNKLLEDPDDLNVIIEDWLMISSPNFKDPSMFPTIFTPNEKRQVKVDLHNFRINSYYQNKVYDNSYPPSQLHFWFRYTKKNIYYTPSNDNINILGSISIKELSSIEHNSEANLSNCLLITTINQKTWNLCSNEAEIRHKWFCQISLDLGVNNESCEKLILDKISTPTVIETKVTQPIILIPLPSENCNQSWNYSNGGSDWECDCLEGKEQSPINIESYRAITSPVKPVFMYFETEEKIPFASPDGDYSKGDNIKIKLDHQRLSIKYPDFGKAVTLDGVSYRAEEIIFHSPSEHTIDGKQYDLEVEVVHFGQSKGFTHKKLVLNILYEKYPGVYNKFFEDIDIFNLPNPLNPERSITKKLHLHKLFYNSEEDGYLNMKYFDFYTYQGSMTSPPCEESVIHIVTSVPVKVGSTVLHLFKEALNIPDTIDEEGNIKINTGTVTNSRVVMPLNGRKVYFYDSPAENKDWDIISKNKNDAQRPEGHYEKVKKSFTQYFHVNTDSPSGLPNAYVVPKKEAEGHM